MAPKTAARKNKKVANAANREFSPLVKDLLKSYVYRLIDPRDGLTFYIGKGVGNRIFYHEKEARNPMIRSNKVERIRAIHKAGEQVRYIIHRHGLTEDQAFEVEAALIDVYRERGLIETDNQVAGHHSGGIGIRELSEVVATYEPEPAVITDEAILINIRQAYHTGMTTDELYEATRKSWACSPLKYNATHAYAVKDGLIKGVFAIKNWRPSRKLPGRWEFTGQLDKELSRKYLNRSVRNYFSLGNQNPIRWINTKKR